MLKMLSTGLLINLLFLIIAILSYFALGLHKKQTNSPRQIALYAIGFGLMTVLCLMFGTKLSDTQHADLRYVIIVFSILLYGKYIGPVLLISIWVNKVIFGYTQSPILSLFAATFIYSIALMARKTFLNATIKKQIYIANVVVLASCLFSTGSYFLTTNHEHPVLEIVIYIGCNMLATTLVIYLTHILFSQQELKNQMVNVEKYQLVSEMAAAISHEIRNPLTSTKGFLQLLSATNLTPEEKKMYISFALDGVEQANKVINDYLMFAKPASDKQEMIFLREAIEKNMGLITPLTNMSNIVIHFEPCEEKLVIYGDQQKFDQCMINLLKNGIEAMPNSGLLSIKLTQENDVPTIYISDNGLGMSDKQLKRLGSPFYSTKEKGTGLGMMVVFSILETMKATIRIDSKESIGTTVKISFPKIK